MKTDLLTVDEAAAFANVSRATLYRRIASGEIPSVRIGTTVKAPIRVPRSALIERIYGAANVKPPRETHSRVGLMRFKRTFGT